MTNFRLDSRLGVMAPMATSKNTVSGDFKLKLTPNFETIKKTDIHAKAC